MLGGLFQLVAAVVVVAPLADAVGVFRQPAPARAVADLRVAPVVDLDVSSYPSDIARFVVAVHVNSIYLVFVRWPAAHVCKECLETIPSIADGNASPAVVLVVVASRVHASLPERLPHEVFGRAAESVCARSAAADFVPKAPARRGVTASQVVASSNMPLGSTSAVANPVWACAL